MLVRQNKYYSNSKNIDTTFYFDEEDYGYFCELDINDKILIEKIPLSENSQNNIINNYVDRYYIYNNHDQKKDDDIISKEDDDDYNEKYNDLYFIINLTFITGTGFILLYLTIM